MHVKKDKMCARGETTSRHRVPSSTRCQMAAHTTTYIRRRLYRYTIRYGGVRHPRSREPTPTLRRNATGVQKHHRLAGRHRTRHASVRQRQRYHVNPEAHASGKLLRREDASDHTAPTVVPRPRTSSRSRLSDHRVSTEPLISSLW